eukprot:PhM_4_TR17800/c0_g2_i1/m.72475
MSAANCALCPSAVDGVLSMLDMSTNTTEQLATALTRLPEAVIANVLSATSPSSVSKQVHQDIEAAQRSVTRLITRLRTMYKDSPQASSELKDHFAMYTTDNKNNVTTTTPDIVCDSTFEALRFSLQATLQCLSALNAVTPKALPVTAIQPLELAQYRLAYAGRIVLNNNNNNDDNAKDSGETTLT